MRSAGIARVLHDARLLVADPAGWRQGVGAVEGAVDGLCDDGTWCAGEAIETAASRLGLDDTPALETLARAIAPAITPGYDPAGADAAIAAIVDWNDAPGRAHAEILAAFDRAASAARAARRAGVAVVLRRAVGGRS